MGDRMLRANEVARINGLRRKLRKDPYIELLEQQIDRLLRLRRQYDVEMGDAGKLMLARALAAKIDDLADYVAEVRSG